MTNEPTLRSYLMALPADEAVAVRQRLDRLRRDCGCGVGSIVMLSATCFWIVHVWSAPETGRSWQHVVVTGLLVAFVSGLLGKLMGLGLARVRFHMTVRALRQRASSWASARDVPAANDGRRRLHGRSDESCKAQEGRGRSSQFAFFTTMLVASKAPVDGNPIQRRTAPNCRASGRSAGMML